MEWKSRRIISVSEPSVKHVAPHITLQNPNGNMDDHPHGAKSRRREVLAELRLPVTLTAAW